MSVRRILFFSLSLTTAVFMLWLMHSTLSNNTPYLLHAFLLALFAMTLPWMVVGFWNAIIGLILCQFSKDPTSLVFPNAAACFQDKPLTSSTAILLCIRNELPERLVRNLQAMLKDLVNNGWGKNYHIFILSDTNDPSIAQFEDAAFNKLSDEWKDQIFITYRRRESNEGFKAGNIEDFCQRWGTLHEYAIVLDADSFMTGSAMSRLVRIMENDHRLGIVQGLVVGLPSASAFTRLFQYGMRLGMRSYTMGSSWWLGDCGPYWGHNAIIRLEPFIDHCNVALLKTGSKHKTILSHDLIEAILMRRAGYEVRVFPCEDQSYEENPPTLSDYIQRDLRWCEGNLQYIHLLRLENLHAMGRFQLFMAIAMFAGSPAWILLMLITVVSASTVSSFSEYINTGFFQALIVASGVMWYLPKIAGALDVLLRRRESHRFGGRTVFVKSLLLETFFSFLMTPITWLNHSFFIIGLVLGHQGGWSTQSRDDHVISWRQASQQFFPHTLIGIFLSVLLLWSHPSLFPIGLFFFGGLALAIPLVVLTSQAWLGEKMIQHQWLSSPEEIGRSEVLQPLQLKSYSIQEKFQKK
ncbi:glucans biosynthesis glucosyltransferase MdoH [Limnohabitans sp. Rim28]|jgi:membrane glycosyltransferase|uniref:glucans biosynthesis glucosyltransferase MdoH n=1 Tax=Limnohabitans sp. Rim28 TaxID=1100720 RepID=UPI00036D6855|nr:glucans biosynthesis glucosyltransferase MdoH [Limnohabitans sp. Rim28]PVE08713.1 glucan biosynthesis glucosyltransferase H [Limnohabitans sp. Rim28]